MYMYNTSPKVVVRKNCNHVFSKTLSPVLTVNTLLYIAIILIHAVAIRVVKYYCCNTKMYTAVNSQGLMLIIYLTFN